MGSARALPPEPWGQVVRLNLRKLRLMLVERQGSSVAKPGNTSDEASSSGAPSLEQPWAPGGGGKSAAKGANEGGAEAEEWHRERDTVYYEKNPARRRHFLLRKRDRARSRQQSPSAKTSQPIAATQQQKQQEALALQAKQQLPAAPANLSSRGSPTADNSTTGTYGGRSDSPALLLQVLLRNENNNAQQPAHKLAAATGAMFTTTSVPKDACSLDDQHDGQASVCSQGPTRIGSEQGMMGVPPGPHHMALTDPTPPGTTEVGAPPLPVDRYMASRYGIQPDRTTYGVAVSLETSPQASTTAGGNPAATSSLLVCARASCMPTGMNRHHWCMQDYSPLHWIHRGRDSSLYWARCSHSGEPVMIKLYDLRELNTVTRRQVLREARLQAGLQLPAGHPNHHSAFAHHIQPHLAPHHSPQQAQLQLPCRAPVTQLYAAFQQGPLLALVMEYAAGGNLLSCLRSVGTVRLDVAGAAHLVRAVALALQPLHALGIIHRNLRLDNVLVHPPPGLVPVSTPGTSVHRSGGPCQPQPGRMAPCRSSCDLQQLREDEPPRLTGMQPAAGPFQRVSRWGKQHPMLDYPTQNQTMYTSSTGVGTVSVGTATAAAPAAQTPRRASASSLPLDTQQQQQQLPGAAPPSPATVQLPVPKVVATALGVATATAPPAFGRPSAPRSSYTPGLALVSSAATGGDAGREGDTDGESMPRTGESAVSSVLRAQQQWLQQHGLGAGFISPPPEPLEDATGHVPAGGGTSSAPGTAYSAGPNGMLAHSPPRLASVSVAGGSSAARLPSWTWPAHWLAKWLKLSDFSQACDTRVERPCTRRGSLYHMAPEMLTCPTTTHVAHTMSGHGGSLDGSDDEDALRPGPMAPVSGGRMSRRAPYGVRVDVWALGVLAYQLLHQGRLPFFDANSPRRTAEAIRSASPVIDGHVPPAARSFLLACLTKDPAQRPSVDELLQHEWLQGAATGGLSGTQTPCSGAPQSPQPTPRPLAAAAAVTTATAAPSAGGSGVGAASMAQMFAQAISSQLQVRLDEGEAMQLLCAVLDSKASGPAQSSDDGARGSGASWGLSEP